MNTRRDKAHFPGNRSSDTLRLRRELREGWEPATASMEPRPIRRLAEEVVNRVAAGEASASRPTCPSSSPPSEISAPHPNASFGFPFQRASTLTRSLPRHVLSIVASRRTLLDNRSSIVQPRR